MTELPLPGSVTEDDLELWRRWQSACPGLNRLVGQRLPHPEPAGEEPR